MSLSNAAVKELLEHTNKISPAKIKELEAATAKGPDSLEELLYRRKLLSERELTELYAASLKLKFIDLASVKIDPKLVALIPEHIARRYQAVVFGKEADKYKLAVADPEDLPAIDALEKLLGKERVDIYVAPRGEIINVLGRLRSKLESEITKVIPEATAETEEVSVEELSEDSPVAKTANLIIEYALNAGASDIHIEPRESNVQVRYRVDGVLREAETLPRRLMAALVSRIKIMANLKIDEHRTPQDGRFKITNNERTVAIRVSVIPVMDGEKVVMRLLDESSRALTLEELGFNSSALERMQRAMVQPHGLILVTGPTGSGKSTTLYSVLSMLNTPKVNISTVEDPVEYRIAGVNQTQVNPKAGMTFAGGLRALLRQDPNIIMVGEIRDSETADLAIQAALTGHLVLSTLHTNNASTTLPRLLDMGAEPFLIASTVRVAIGQRLVRKLCPTCRVKYSPAAAEAAQLKQQFQLEAAAAQLKTGLEGAPTPAKTTSDTGDKTGLSGPETLAALTKASGETFEIYKAGPGCEDCERSGYKGRLGIYEVLELSPEIAKLIISSATSEMIQKAAVEQGMISMQTDGFIKALLGLTSIEEVLRVTRA